MDKIERFLNYTLESPDNIPNIPLYMDQVTSYLEDLFSDLRVNEDDKVLTKTMINNYVKAQVISSPIKKKYDQENIIKLMMLYLLKNTLSLSQIDLLFKRMDNVEDMYKKFIDYDQYVRDSLKADQPKDISEAYILKLLLSSQLQKKYAEILLESLVEKEKAAEEAAKGKKKAKKNEEKTDDIV